MEQETYKGDLLQKIAGLSFIVGTILLVVFGLLHPTEDLEDLSATIQNIADSNGGFLEIDHIFIAVAFWGTLDRNGRRVPFHLLGRSRRVGAHRPVRNDYCDHTQVSILGNRWRRTCDGGGAMGGGDGS